MRQCRRPVFGMRPTAIISDSRKERPIASWSREPAKLICDGTAASVFEDFRKDETGAFWPFRHWKDDPRVDARITYGFLTVREVARRPNNNWPESPETAAS
ncbi:MAG: hypothetical protein IPJ30_24110 [Acidobacteria bacterium]|nr:hypothetical protein [Acidobacteriota bacterium]